MDLPRFNDLTNPADLARLNQWVMEITQRSILRGAGRAGVSGIRGAGGGTTIINNTGGGGGGGGTTTVLTNITGENLTSQIDGLTTAFTVTYAPDPPAATLLLYNGNFQVQPTHYSISGTTLTTVFTPLVGDNLYTIYPYQPVATLGSITGENLTSLIDGFTTVFPLTFPPSPGAALILMYNGNFQVQPTHYTLVSSTITLSFTPSVGDNLYAIYPR